MSALPNRTKKKPRISTAEIPQAVSDLHYYNLCYQTREIYLMSHYSEGDGVDDPGVDYRSSGTFIRNIRLLDQLGRARILIHMQIIGGSWPDGMAIYDIIRSSKSQTVILAYAQAASMSGVILQAADRRIMMPDTHFMLHHGWMGVDNTAQGASEQIKFNDMECRKMIQIFAGRAVSGAFFKQKRWGEKRIAEYLDHEIRQRGDWYMTADEAVNMGFADEIFTGWAQVGQ